MAGVGKPWQAFDDTRVEASGTVESLPKDPTNGRDGIASTEQVAAELRPTEFPRPEGLLPARIVAERLGLSVATVNNDSNARKLRCVLFGSVRRVLPEDFEAYAQVRRLSSRASTSLSRPGPRSGTGTPDAAPKVASPARTAR